MRRPSSALVGVAQRTLVTIGIYVVIHLACGVPL
jgi:hypothetical protein